MVTVRDVPADKLIEELVQYLKQNVPQVRPPPWAIFAKTGPHKERIPENPDWWYYRAASVLRKLYLAEEPMGVGTFRVIYGGLERRGSAPSHFRKCGGSHIRRILQQLERAGLVVKTQKGRLLSSRGRRLLDTIAYKAFSEIVKVRPELVKYGSTSTLKQLQQEV
ncbi:MAG: 30S ribosomal protein S19e [Ignisphaera sp.]|uniref:Small ribosomal subunit protein eS19 n=1 Tax=Ignisphaera aggregans TaxID=334771 RepID=A0A7C4NLY1_9CREN